MSQCAAACKYQLMAVLNFETFDSTLIMRLLCGQGRELWWSPTLQPYWSCAGTPILLTAPFVETFPTLHWTFSVSPASRGGGSLRGVETSAISMEMAFWRTHSAVTGLCITQSPSKIQEHVSWRVFSVFYIVYSSACAPDSWTPYIAIFFVNKATLQLPLFFMVEFEQPIIVSALVQHTWNQTCC